MISSSIIIMKPAGRAAPPPAAPPPRRRLPVAFVTPLGHLRKFQLNSCLLGDLSFLRIENIGPRRRLTHPPHPTREADRGGRFF